MQKSAFQEQKLAAYDTRQVRTYKQHCYTKHWCFKLGLVHSRHCVAQNAYQNGWKTSLTGAIAADCPCEAQHFFVFAAHSCRSLSTTESGADQTPLTCRVLLRDDLVGPPAWSAKEPFSVACLVGWQFVTA